MWLLKASLSDNIFWAKPGAEFLIGRNAQVNIRSSDTSISRRHAKITCSTIDPFESATSTLHIFSDKVNAVFVNGKPIPPSTEFPLNNGDIILVGSNQEGSYNFEITVSKQVYSLCLSGMSDLEAKKFAAIASSADIHLTHSFNSKTTHLLMNSIRVTFKVIISLLNCIPIVNPEWLTALLNLNSNNYIKIETLKYVPKLGEKLEYPVSFEPNKARQRLLKELTFIVFSKDEFNHLNQIIPLAGGDLLLFSDPITILEKFLSTLKAPRIFVPSKSSPLYSKVLEITKRNAKFIRVITENDIGNAILSCDLDHVNVSNSDHLNIESIYADSQDESQSSFLKPVPVVSQPANVNSMNSYQSQAPDSMFSKLATSQLKDSRIPIQKKFSFLSNLDSLLDDDSPAVTSYRSNTVNRSNTVQLKPITHSESRKLDSIAEKATGISLYVLFFNLD